MTPADYRAALETLGLSQLAAGRWLGVGNKTAQNYADMKGRGPSGPASRAISLALKMQELGLDWQGEQDQAPG